MIWISSSILLLLYTKANLTKSKGILGIVVIYFGIGSDGCFPRNPWQLGCVCVSVALQFWGGGALRAFVVNVHDV